METRYLEQLITIEKSKSMRDAAEKLYLSQGALSHNIKKIEAEFDCELFDRSRNQLSLNSYGQIILNHANAIIDEIETAKKEIQEEKGKNYSQVNVGVYSYAFQTFVLPSIANAVKENSFDSYIRTQDELETGLVNDFFDVIFTDKPINQAEYVTERLFKEQIMISMPPTSEYASRQNIYLSDLEKLNILLVENASGYTDWFKGILEEAQVNVPKENIVTFKDYLYIKDSVDQCHFTGSFIMRFLPTAARRVVLPLAEDIAFRSIYIVYKKNKSSKLKYLNKLIEEHHDRLFTGTGFLPFLLFPESENNLVIE